MKTPLKWLSEYVDIQGLTPQQISEGLRFSGTENVLLSGLELPNVVVGEIKEITKHPNADKLQVAIVSIAGKSKEKKVKSDGSGQKPDGEPLTIVCGAPNIKTGQKVPVALVGAKFADFEIKKAEIRGVESNGMLCSEKELGLSEDHTGIMILDQGAKVGQLLQEHIGEGEAVIDAELTPNRGDCLSMVGMAREVAATFGLKFKMPKIKKPDIKSKLKIDVEVIDKNLCPRYIAKVVEGVKIGPSPKWMQERLTAAGVRPISNVVDVTNYVMLELGQPLHAFDFSKLQATSSKLPPKIIVRKAKAGEKIVTLDSVSRSLTADDLLICDAKKPVALAGVMGGLNSEVDDKTTKIVLEAAVFNPTSVRKTAQRLDLRSEASNRFEKGIPLALPEIAIERAAELLAEISKEKKEKSDIEVGANTDVLSSWIWIQRVGLRLSRIKSLLGIDITEERALEILDALGFEAEKFDFKKEARKHVGKPYVFGASYKTHGDMAFDCSYLTDYIYSKIGKFIGYTSLAQYQIGKPVKSDELRVGDVLFIKGHIDKSATDHYFRPDGKGNYDKVSLDKPKEVGHNALYIGNGRIIHARHFEYDAKNDKWKKLATGKVVEEDATVFTENPQYLGARRFVDDPNDYIAITVPWWRGDIRIEEDILEELARIQGYDKIPATLPSGQLPGITQNTQVVASRGLRDKLVGMGFTDVINNSFVSQKLIEISGHRIQESAKINNPLSSEQEYMRLALWPSMVEVAVRNQDRSEVKIFEIANTYPDKGKEERPHLSLSVLTDSADKAFYEIKGALLGLFKMFNIEAPEIKPTGIDFADPGRGAEIRVNGKKIGKIGNLSDVIAGKMGFKKRLAIAEIDLSSIIGSYGREIIYKPLPKYPISSRDINIVFSDSVLVSEIIKNLAQISAPNLLGYRVVDVYQGKGLAESEKSVTINLQIGSDIKTLTDDEINKTVDAVLKNLKRVGGELRS